MLRSELGRFMATPKVGMFASVGNIRGRIVAIDGETIDLSTREDGLLRNIPILSLN